MGVIMTTPPFSHLDPGRPGLAALLGPPDPRDIYLAPHSDDVCFSIGALAASRRAGTLLTVFSVSRYLADARAALRASVLDVTRRRMAEDTEFARRVGLSARWLGLSEAPIRGEMPFDDAPIAPAVQASREALLAALIGPTLGQRAARRPWLFCPLGVGAHRDHRTVRAIVLSAFGTLAVRYRIGFYEDLHYAADLEARRKALEGLSTHAPALAMTRLRHDLSQDVVRRKMALLGLHASQLPAGWATVERFTPALPMLSGVPHEAVWVVQSDIAQASG